MWKFWHEALVCSRVGMSVGRTLLAASGPTVHACSVLLSPFGCCSSLSLPCGSSGASWGQAPGALPGS